MRKFFPLNALVGLTMALTFVLALVASAIFSAIPAHAADAAIPAQPQIVMFDGCEGRLVEGTNYYNLTDPRCKTVSSQFSSSPGEDKRRELAEAAAKAAAKPKPAS